MMCMRWLPKERLLCLQKYRSRGAGQIGLIGIWDRQSGFLQSLFLSHMEISGGLEIHSPLFAESPFPNAKSHEVSETVIGQMEEPLP